MMSEIQILRADDHSILVHSVKVETEPGDGLLYDYNAILFSIPDGLLHEGTNYTLSLPEGLARGYSTCEPWSKPAAWDFYIGTGRFESGFRDCYRGSSEMKSNSELNV